MTTRSLLLGTLLLPCCGSAEVLCALGAGASSYLPAQDIYIPKETKVNSEIERLRVEATAALMQRKDVIIITSVSCIYSLGDPTEYKNLSLQLHTGMTINRMDLIKKLIFKRKKITPGFFLFKKRILVHCQ